MSSFDVIVIGMGGVGSATVLSFARRGVRVLGIDRFGPVHDRGSSHGETRLIRQAYFEHPDYVPLLLSAYERWHELERNAGCRLFFPTGLIEIGPPDGVVLPGVSASANQHGLSIERLSAADFERQFPQFALPSGCEAVLETTAGVLMVEECVRAHLDQATMLGADLRFNEPVASWSADGNGVVVDTTAGRYSAGHLVITAGAWSSNLMGGLGLPLRVVRKHLHWFSSNDERYRLRSGCPAFFFELADGCFYGFPEMRGSDLGVKVAEHSGGENVLDPSNLERSIDAQDQGRVVEFLGRCAPTVSTNPTHHSVCMYTLTSDEHFILDFHPDHPNVSFAAGLSGHGFKLAPVLGEALSDLTLERATPHPVAFLGLARFGQGPIHKA